MSRKDFFIWLGLLVVTTVALGLWIFMSRPNETEIAQATPTVPPLGVDHLSDETFANLYNREINGDLPVPPASTESPRTDPFK